MKYPKKYDVIVVGGGHAGTEACLAAARMGLSTLLITHNIETVGQLSCNPSIGGIGKGQLIKEIDAMGGAMGICADKAAINIKVLNKSKGPAMYGHHAVLDRKLYKNAVREIVENQKNLEIFQQSVEDLIIRDNTVCGVITQLGIEIESSSVVLTNGTFLNGLIHVGLKNHKGGRAGEMPSIGLAEKLKQYGLPQGRLKTGTPARIDGKTIDFSKMEAHYSDGVLTNDLPVFSFMGKKEMHPKQIPCYMTKTNEKTHDILREGFSQSPMFTGVIEGVGPRYCPSIEDKITRFKDRDSHQIILEPEGLDVVEYYPNGISTSLPFEIQYRAIRTIAGLENAHLTRPGYAIEYDYYNPTCLKKTCEVKKINGLFFAGQIIGTTGYSEAAALGLLAGINAGRYARSELGWYPERYESYMGVMIDDLVYKGILEPYRVFTSRAEYRLILREDNADIRLTAIAKDLGLINDERWNCFTKKTENIENLLLKIEKMWVANSHDNKVYIENILKFKGDGFNFKEFLKRPEVSIHQLIQVPSIKDIFKGYGKEVLEQVEINIKYEGYIKRQQDEIENTEKFSKMLLPNDFDYNKIKTLSNEVKQKLNEYKPSNIDEASKIQGVTLSAISILMVEMKKKANKQLVKT